MGPLTRRDFSKSAAVAGAAAALAPSRVLGANDRVRLGFVGLGNRRSTPFCKEAADLLRGGSIGKITAVRSFHIQNEWPKGIGNAAHEENILVAAKRDLGFLRERLRVEYGGA
jgi:hypothetical protein